MKTLIIYYSYTGNTRQQVSQMAKEQSAELVEVKEKKVRSKFNAYFWGSFAAMRQKKSVIEPINCNLTEYDHIIIAMPIWAGYPAPVMNNVIELLPEGKEVELVMVSASGDSSKSADNTKTLIMKRGSKVVKYTDIKC